jgi:hypothetical protein
MAEHSESAGEEARPAADVKAVEKAAELQHQRAAFPSQECLYAREGCGGLAGRLGARGRRSGSLEWVGEREDRWIESQMQEDWLLASGDLGLVPRKARLATRLAECGEREPGRLPQAS